MFYFGPNTLTKEYFMQQLVESPPPVVAVDCETISLDERMPVGFSIATTPDESFYFQTFPEPDPALHYLTNVLTNPAIKKVFHNCVPANYKALTHKGWKGYGELGIGDSVLGYNQKSSNLEWTRITGIVEPRNMEIAKFGNSRYTFRASLDHRWYGTKYNTYSRKFKHVEFTTAELLNNKYLCITLSANYNIDGESPITEDEARVIAWIITDGSIKWFKKNSVVAYIAQSKYPDDIYFLVKDNLTSIQEQPGRNDNQRLLYRFYLKAKYVKYLWQRAQLNKDLSNLDEFILSLSSKARKAFFDTVYDAEGYQGSIPPKIAQKKSLVKVRAIQLLSFLMGYFPTLDGHSISLVTPVITGQHLNYTVSNENAWCVSTELGSWVAYGDDQMFITGNCPFDLRNMPLVVPIESSNIADTAVMARLLGAQDATLYLLAIEVNKSTTPAREILAKYKTKSMLDVPADIVAQHCADDSRCTLALYHHYLPHINPTYFAVEMAVVPILIKMGLRGVKFSEPDRVEMENKLEADLEYYSKMIKSLGVDNPNSGQQVGFILAKRGNFLPLTRSRKQLKTDEDTLEFLDDPLAQIVLSYKHNNTLLTKYIWPMKGQDRIYTDYNLDARVGRISSSKMNMQNLPGKNPTRPRVEHYNIRNIIVPDSGTYTTGDFSQEHLYIIMHLSGDRQMEKVYIEGYMNGDIHSFTAQELFGTVTPNTRKIAKTLNYAIAYGATAKTISQQAKIQDVRKCSEFLDRWFKTFREAAEWIKGAQREGLRDGWSLPTVFGRRIRLPDDEGEEGMKSKAINYPVQGSDGEIMKRALIICDKYKLPLAVTVHDSITLDGNCEFPVEELEHIAPVRIPFEVTKTLRWE